MNLMNKFQIKKEETTKKKKIKIISEIFIQTFNKREFLN